MYCKRFFLFVDIKTLQQKHRIQPIYAICIHIICPNCITNIKKNLTRKRTFKIAFFTYKGTFFISKCSHAYRRNNKATYWHVNFADAWLLINQYLVANTLFVFYIADILISDRFSRHKKKGKDYYFSLQKKYMAVFLGMRDGRSIFPNLDVENENV